MIRNEIVNFFSNLALRHIGIVIGKEKAYLIESRLDELSKSLGLNNIEELYKKAKSNLTNELLNKLIDALTTNETYFFRDKIQFEALKKYVIPELIQNNSSKKSLRIWSCACSTGQEPYSIALLINEYFPELLKWRLEIIGSDISKKVIEYAKKGEFSQIEVNRGLPARMLAKYFTQKGNKWVLDSRIRKMVRFVQINLKDSFIHLGKFDIIFCRYVLIYFSDELKKDILQRLEKSLNPGGYLFLGGSEILPPFFKGSIRRKELGGCICYQLPR